ncbi:hypothetical protein KQX54_010771 [Cotesia glomerata]|uniref:Uncharacterized protein n=1 Tax=Cotesia glomerata TaxID=32391 RepID=A0AAV7IS24_COTGL|nr:hypothetical protein KQX54_010771 [Cotesia glomerata]
MRLVGKRQTTKAAGKVFQRLDDDIESLYINHEQQRRRPKLLSELSIQVHVKTQNTQVKSKNSLLFSCSSGCLEHAGLVPDTETWEIVSRIGRERVYV